jgi:hypothetical protein
MTLHLPRLPVSLDQLIAEAKRRARQRRVLVATAVVLVAGGGAGAAILGSSSSAVAPGSRASRVAGVCGVSLGAVRAGLLPTVAQPLSCAKRMTLAGAGAALGVPLVLPKTLLGRSTSVGAVWGIVSHRAGRKTGAVVAATFPAQGVIIEYERPAPSSGSAAHFQAMANGIPAAKVVNLRGTPAFVTQQNADANGNNFGAVLFNLGGSEVSVMAHRDEATLEALALSILKQSTAPKE